MPQNFARSWRLGRNPATEIARFLASRLGNGARVIENALASTNPGLPHQGEVATRSDRDQIVRSFRLNENLDDRVVILVDDFVTTGNTIRAAAEALKRVGFQAREVHVAALTRPLLSRHWRRSDGVKTNSLSLEVLKICAIQETSNQGRNRSRRSPGVQSQDPRFGRPGSQNQIEPVGAEKFSSRRTCSRKRLY